MHSPKFEVAFGGKLQFPIWLIILGVPIGYFLWNIGRYSGPAFLADEIGYLSNAIFLSGHWVDGGSSYHAGYSLLLVPLFLVFDNTATIWTGAMLINSLLWMGAFYFSNKLIAHWDREMPLSKRVIILLLVSLYPTWITMSGYVFTTPAFVALFMAGVFCLIHAIKDKGKGMCFFTVCVGLLYWIHPIGLVAAGVSIIAVGLWGVQDRRSFYIWLGHSVGCVLFVILYKYVIHPSLLTAMTPEGHAPMTHYPDTSSILSKIRGFDFWLQLSIHSLGQISYFLVGSLGVALFGVCSILKTAAREFKAPSAQWKSLTGVYILGVLAGVIVMGATNFSLEAATGKLIADWLYGRYLDSVCIPILIVGLIALVRAGWRERISLLSPCLLVVVFSACILHIAHEAYPPNPHNLIVNTVALWPQYLAPAAGVGIWILMGTVGIFLTYIGGWRLLGLLSPVLLVLSSSPQATFHKNILGDYSAPTALVDVVRENYPQGSYISFDWDSSREKSWFHKERFSLYKYYLYKYRYHRVSKKGWGADNSDLLLTYAPEKYADIGIEILRESRSGLSLVKRKSSHDLKITETTSTRGIIVKGDANGPLPERVTFYADDLVKMTQVGKLVGESILSEGGSGYLFFGPYINLSQGEYFLTVSGKFSQANSATLDVVANEGRDVFLREVLANQERDLGEVVFKFSLDRDVFGLEIRLFVTDADSISVRKYSLDKY